MKQIVIAVGHWFLAAWIVMLALGVNGHAAWGFWHVFLAEWAVELVIGGSVASGLLLAAIMSDD